MILTNQPRLYMTTTQVDYNREGLYRSDILLFSNLKIMVRKGNLEIHCPNSGKTFIFMTEFAKEWKIKIQSALLDHEFDDNSMDF